MKLKLLKYHIKNAITENPSIYVLIVISQIIAIVGVLFLYGVFGSYLMRLEQLDMDSYEIGATFEDAKWGELQNIFPESLNEIENIDYVFVGGVNKEIPISSHFEYENGIMSQSQTVNKNAKIMEGRVLTGEDYQQQSKVIYSNNGMGVGEKVKIGNTTFEVVGTDEVTKGGYEIPFNSDIGDVTMCVIVVNFKELPKQKDYLVLKNTLEQAFGDRVLVDEFEIKEENEIIEIRTIITITVVVGIISALNVCLLFGYIISRRKKQMAIYGTVGMSKGKRMLINQLEIVMVTVLSLGTGELFFHVVLRKIILEIYDNIERLYGFRMYGMVFLIYFVCTLAVTNIMLRLVNKDNLSELLRRSKGD